MMAYTVDLDKANIMLDFSESSILKKAGVRCMNLKGVTRNLDFPIGVCNILYRNSEFISCFQH